MNLIGWFPGKIHTRRFPGRLDALSLVVPTVVLLLDFCCSSVSVLVLLSSAHLLSSQFWILVYMFAVLMHRSVRNYSCGLNILYVYEPQQNLGRGLWLSSFWSFRSFYFYFMLSLLYVFLTSWLSGRRYGIGLYRSLIVAFSFTSQQY